MTDQRINEQPITSVEALAVHINKLEIPNNRCYKLQTADLKLKEKKTLDDVQEHVRELGGITGQ